MKSGIITNDFGSIDWDVYSDPILDEEGYETEGEEYIKIDNLEVKEAFRGQGKGRELLEAAIVMICAENNITRGDIRIVPEPKDSITDFSKLSSFYERAGLMVVAY